MGMFGFFQRPKLAAHFAPSEAITDEFARQITLGGDLTISNDGSESHVGDVELMVIAGFRRIPLEVPDEWREFHVAPGRHKQGHVRWSLTLDAPLRAESGELAVSVRDQKRRKWDWRLPFTFERR
jgi:hypothetical protein